MITPQQAIERLISNNELFYDEMTDLMRQIMSGQVPPEQIAAILTGLRIKVETVSEITAAAAVMREFAAKVPLENSDDLVDIVGTGGDGAKTFNISTTFRFLVQRRGGRDGADGRGIEHYAGTSRRKHPSDRLGLYVCPKPPQRDAPRRARAPLARV